MHPNMSAMHVCVWGGVGEGNTKGKEGGGEVEEVMLGGSVVNCSIFAGNLNAN